MEYSGSKSDRLRIGVNEYKIQNLGIEYTVTEFMSSNLVPVPEFVSPNFWKE
jgi:hypothetical protein